MAAAKAAGKPVAANALPAEFLTMFRPGPEADIADVAEMLTMFRSDPAAALVGNGIPSPPCSGVLSNAVAHGKAA